MKTNAWIIVIPDAIWYNMKKNKSLILSHMTKILKRRNFDLFILLQAWSSHDIKSRITWQDIRYNKQIVTFTNKNKNNRRKKNEDTISYGSIEIYSGLDSGNSSSLWIPAWYLIICKIDHKPNINLLLARDNEQKLRIPTNIILRAMKIYSDDSLH